MRSSIQAVLLTAAATTASAAVLPPSSPLVLYPSSPSQQSPVIATLAPSLQTAIIATNLTLPPPALLGDFPGHEHFKVKIQLGAIFLPPASVLLNVLNFMSTIAHQTYDQKLAPRTYSTPGYRDVQITSFAWTEPRFLLWAIFYAVDYMITYARFHEVLLELYWDENVVGRLKVAAGGPYLISAGGEATQDLVPSAQSNTTTASTAGESVNVRGGASDSDIVVPLAAANASAAALSVRPPYTVRYQSLPGATKVSRNDLFELFYAAIVHVAQYNSGSLMREFQTKSPNEKLLLSMKEHELGCQVSRELT